jgi:hypothetical protein
LAGGSSLRETVIGAVLAGGTLVVDQPLDVGGIFVTLRARPPCTSRGRWFK